MLDSYNRAIRYLRISVTQHCNLRCWYCVGNATSDRRCGGDDELLSFESIVEIARAAVGLGVEKLRLTGGEPLLRPGIVELARELSGIEGLKELRMTTNGTLLAPLARDLRAAGLQSVNVSLDSVDPERYKTITGGGRLADVQAGIDAALEAGLGVKLNIVVQPDDDRDASEAERYAEERGIAAQRIRLYDLREPKRDDPDFDRPPPCCGCDKIRLLADGRLLPCLHSNLAFPIDMGRIEESLEECIRGKPARGLSCEGLDIWQIGG